jgi:hypothetical protein
MNHAIYGGFAFLPGRTRAGTPWGEARLSRGAADGSFRYSAANRHIRCERDQAPRRPA